MKLKIRPTEVVNRDSIKSRKVNIEAVFSCYSSVAVFCSQLPSFALFFAILMAFCRSLNRKSALIVLRTALKLTCYFY